MKVLSIALSEACNLNCTYCNVDKNSKKSIDPLIFLEDFKKIRQENPKERIQVDFYGGEPLLQYNKIKFIIESISDTNVQYYMPTNGLLLDEEKLLFFKKNNVNISLSYDGLWQTNRKQGNKNISNIYLEKRDFFKTIPNFKIHTMIYPGNYNLLENHLFLLEYGANANFTLVKDIGVWNNESVELLKKGIDELVEWYINNVDNEEIPETLKQYINSVVLFKSKGYIVKSCGAGFDHLSFSENKIISCNRFKNEPELEKLIPVFLEMNKCNNCEIKNYCKKGCMYENIKNDGPIDEVCEIFKYFFNKTFYIINKLKTNNRFKELLTNIIKEEYGINQK